MRTVSAAERRCARLSVDWFAFDHGPSPSSLPLRLAGGVCRCTDGGGGVGGVLDANGARHQAVLVG